MESGNKRPTTTERIHETNVASIEGISPRPTGSVYMGGFKAPALETVRLAVIGLGERHRTQIEQLVKIPHCRIVGVCDTNPEAVKAASETLFQEEGMRPAAYGGSEDAPVKMLRDLQPDGVIISTLWENHAELAIAAMEHGSHAFVEVPMATTIADLWRVIDTSERTQKHCMMLENVNYGREELMFLNMVRQGLIGDLLHGEAAYIHELREQMHQKGSSELSWRARHYAARNGNLYPTHGLGPVAQYMNLARGEDMFESIVSLSSPALGREKYERDKLRMRENTRTPFACGDINTSVIKTQAGRTILLQWDETTPRPYDRRNMIQGTEGVLAGFPTRIAGERISPIAPGGERDYSRWYQGEAAERDLYDRYDHPLYKRLGKQAEACDRRGGMNYIMFHRLIECLHRGEALDQNVYEGAFWSAVAPLSEKSVHEGGAPQRFPDFTRGDWKTTSPLPIIN